MLEWGQEQMKERVKTNKAKARIPDWEKVGISNDFMFYKVMQDEALLRELIHRILPDLKIGKINIRAQKLIDIANTHMAEDEEEEE